MLNVAVGTVLGFLSGLGVGGGSLLVLWLTLFVGMDAPHARCINLMFFVPCALISSLFRWKQGHLPLKKILLPMLLGCATAALCALLSGRIDDSLLKKLFGGLLLFTGVKEMLYREK